jgi:hypothetical protein
MKKIIVFILFLSVTLFAQKGKYGFTVSGAVNFPSGDFNDYYNTQFGGYGGVFYNFSETGRVGLIIGYNSWSLDLDALNNTVKENGNKGHYNIEAPINSIPVLLYVKFFFKTETEFHPYVIIEGGAYKISREIYGKYINENGNSNNVNYPSTDITSGGITPGFGFEYPINEILNLDAAVKYHYIFNEDVYNLGDYGYAASYSTHHFVSIDLGINIIFE